MAEVNQNLRLTENSENVLGVAAVKKGLANAVSRRPALGTITNNGTRVQPTRAAKQSKGFTIFSDDAENQPPCGAAPAREPLKPAAQKLAAPAAPAAPAAVPKRPFGIFEDKPVPTKQDKDKTTKPKGLSSRATDVVLSSFNVQQNVGNIPRVFQLAEPEQHLDKESPMKIDTSLKIDSSLMQLEDSLPDIEDVDSKDDPVFDCPEYARDIYEYLLKFEKKTRPRSKYMIKQQDINMNMRAILADWLVEVAEEYKLHDETLYLAINYIDRFLSQMSVLRGKLQLVGTAAMFIAAKFEEIYPPELGEFVYITDDTYSKKQVLRMEHLILKVLNFDMATPTPGVFLRRFNKWTGSDEATESLSKYLAELTLVDGDPFLQYAPSTIAAAAVCLARHTLGHHAWPESVAERSEISFTSLRSCLQDLHRAYLNASSHQQQAVREKYSNAKHHQVSTLNPPTSLPFC